jgi:hypothetical protein
MVNEKLRAGRGGLARPLRPRISMMSVAEKPLVDLADKDAIHAALDADRP